MKPLPKNIYHHFGGYVVRIKRGGVKLIFCTRDLDKAIAKKEAFLELHGRVAIATARSNTGITGITEVTKWWHNHSYDCFQVTTANPSKPGAMKRFFYRAGQRAQALQSAIAHRARALGVTEQEVTRAR